MRSEKVTAAPSKGDLQDRLRHVYWIGGGSGAGKSTVARRLAAEHGMRLYPTDDVMQAHTRLCSPDDAPFLTSFASMSMDERWLTRTPRQMLDTFHWYRGEGFGLIVEDLLRFSAGQPVIAEGFRLLPDLIKPLLADPRQAVWLLPTPHFRQAVFEHRGGTGWSFIAKTSDPLRALRNLLERDRLFTERLARRTRQLDLTAITIDLGIPEARLAQRVVAALGLELRIES